MPNTDDGEGGKSKRNLVRWDDDKDKQLLLCLQYACVKAGIRIPWDKVAEQMGPRFSSGACVQHLAKLRNRMKEEDIPVPPPLPRGMVTTTPSRVYAVATSSSKRRRFSSDDEDDEEYPALNGADDSPTPKPSSKKRKAIKKEPDIKEEDDVMPELYDSDEEYGAAKKKSSKSKTKAKKPSPKKNNRRKSSSQSVEDAREPTPVITPRTRGVRKNYAQMQAPLEELEDVKAESGSDERVPAETADSVAVDVDVHGDPVQDVESDQDKFKAEEPGAGSGVTEIPAAPISRGTALSTTQGLQAPAPIGNNPTGSGVAGDPYVLNMNNTNQGFSSQWGHGMHPGAFNGGAYGMLNYGFMGNMPSLYQNVEDDEVKPTQFGAFEGFSGFSGFRGAGPGMPTLTAPMSTPHGLGQSNSMTVLGGVDGIDISPVSRNSSKESVKSQDSLMGVPAQTATSAGEELDLSTMEDATHWQDTNFEDFINLQ